MAFQAHRPSPQQVKTGKNSATAGETDSRKPNPTDGEDWKLPASHPFAEMKQNKSCIQIVVALFNHRNEQGKYNQIETECL